MKRARYTSEFKFEAVRLVKTGQSMAVVSSTLNISSQTLYNWVKADRDGNLLSYKVWLIHRTSSLFLRIRITH